MGRKRSRCFSLRMELSFLCILFQASYSSLSFILGMIDRMIPNHKIYREEEEIMPRDYSQHETDCPPITLRMVQNPLSN